MEMEVGVKSRGGKECESSLTCRARVIGHGEELWRIGLLNWEGGT